MDDPQEPLEPTEIRMPARAERPRQHERPHEPEDGPDPRSRRGPPLDLMGLGRTMRKEMAKVIGLTIVSTLAGAIGGLLLVIYALADWRATAAAQGNDVVPVIATIVLSILAAGIGGVFFGRLGLQLALRWRLARFQADFMSSFRNRK